MSLRAVIIRHEPVNNLRQKTILRIFLFAGSLKWIFFIC